MANVYDVGDVARLTMVFRSATVTYSSAGEPVVSLALADPSTVTMEMTTPAGTVTAYTYPASITKAATGIYWRNQSWTEAGEWRRKDTGTGAVAQTDSEVYTVQDQGG